MTAYEAASRILIEAIRAGKKPAKFTLSKNALREAIVAYWTEEEDADSNDIFDQYDRELSQRHLSEELMMIELSIPTSYLGFPLEIDNALNDMVRLELTDGTIIEAKD